MPENNNYIVREDLGEIRYLSIMHMKDDIMNYILGIVLFYIFMDLVPAILGFFIPRSYFKVVAGNLDPKLLAQLPDFAFSSFVYVMALGGVLMLGRSLYILRYLRNKQIDYPSILDGVRFFFSATLIYIIQMTVVSILAMFLVIPGIIAFYMFRQAFNVLAEDPSRSAMSCLIESKRLMAGNKFRLFQLDMTYIPFVIFGSLPLVAFSFMGMPNIGEYTKLVATLITFILKLPMYHAMGSMFFGQTVFYELMVAKGFSNFIYKGETVFRAGARAKYRSKE
ncbi:DUF975 family protein [Mogibacterium pumilum]|uniref:DUF975 domain-containing protein n=1 Tax=Mogibacterium pumilum TaxID=86332 RepID=A0A223ASL8_9FIRM|nr:DUF975 family protein [Mogibacterium pumilum]ASS37909.1 hypothetical protein AXF17_05330 [Mogibacterium pumilum]